MIKEIAIVPETKVKLIIVPGSNPYQKVKQ